MTRFEDGPAHGQVLSLSRATIFLRVVEENGVFDALDQPEDTPKPGEKIYAYQCAEYHGTAFVDGTDKETGRRKGWRSAMATYRVVQNQPTDAEMRSTFGWQKWCKEEATRQNLNYAGKE